MSRNAVNATPLHIAICGQGFDAWLCALALRTTLSDTVSVSVVETKNNALESHLYGSILPPEIYQFHLDLGLSEPEFLLKGTSGFCLGTAYSQWGINQRSWVQAFHQPFPVWEGVAFPKIIAALPDVTLQACSISAIAAKAGRFAHPPEDPEHPLSRGEYGYSFDPHDLRKIYRDKALQSGVSLHEGATHSVEREAERIISVTLDDGTSIQADFFIDATGLSALLRSDPLSNEGEDMCLHVEHKSGQELGPAVRQVEADADGWTATTSVRGGSTCISVELASSSETGETTLLFRPGVRSTPWKGNCLAIGLTARQSAPLTLSPIKLLLRDIQRLLGLIPVTSEMSLEARDYNRACHDDVEHASLFDMAHFAGGNLPETDFWTAMSPSTLPEKLDRKIESFIQRGYHVAYDHEPYDALDWALLHDGLGRMPAEPDAMTRALDLDLQEQRVKQMRGNIAAIVRKMPPHALYMTKFIDYLKRKHASHG